MRIKICGITNLDDALAACELGAFALGFNFFRGSPRYIEPEKANLIITQLPPTVLTVGIFINEPLADLELWQQQIGLSLLQVYENFACTPAQKKAMMITIQPKDFTQLPPLALLQEYAFTLIDAPQDASCLLGGTGRLANWELAHYLSKHTKLILAGGIGAHNLQAVVQQVNPFALDICSGAESSPGKKDLHKMREIFKQAHDL